MKRFRRTIITTHDAHVNNLTTVLKQPLGYIRGVDPKFPCASLPVHRYLAVRSEVLCDKEFGCDPKDIERYDAMLSGINPKLVRGIVLTQELTRLLGAHENRWEDPPERPVTWTYLTFLLPKLADNVRGRCRNTMTREEMRIVLDRYRGVLHAQIDDACSSLYEIVDRKPRLAERMIRELIRLGY